MPTGRESALNEMREQELKRAKKDRRGKLQNVEGSTRGICMVVGGMQRSKNGSGI